MTKRLEAGTFSWPSRRGVAVKMRLAPEAFAMLTDGVDLRGARLGPWYEREEKTVKRVCLPVPVGHAICSVKCGINPFDYLRDVLSRLPSMTNWQIKDITPSVWANARPRALLNRAT